MKSLKNYVVVWLAGLIAGLILMERWQGESGVHASAADDTGTGVETEGATRVPADQPGVAAVVVAGARADAERARQLLGRAVPWRATSVPSMAQLRRAHRSAPTTSTPPAD